MIALTPWPRQRAKSGQFVSANDEASSAERGVSKESGEGKCDGGFSSAVFQHKYQINVDGTVAAYRLPYLLVGDSVVLKQDSIYYEHFYNELQPWKHYIPVKSNLSDLLEKLKWAKDHDEEVRSVSPAPPSRARFQCLVPKEHPGC